MARGFICFVVVHVSEFLFYRYSFRFLVRLNDIISRHSVIYRVFMAEMLRHCGIRMEFAQALPVMGAGYANF